MFWIHRKAYDHGYRDAQARYERLMNERVEDLVARFSIHCTCGHDPGEHEEGDRCTGDSLRRVFSVNALSTAVATCVQCDCVGYVRAGYAPGGDSEDESILTMKLA